MNVYVDDGITTLSPDAVKELVGSEGGERLRKEGGGQLCGLRV